MKLKLDVRLGDVLRKYSITRGVACGEEGGSQRALRVSRAWYIPRICFVLRRDKPLKMHYTAGLAYCIAWVVSVFYPSNVTDRVPAKPIMCTTGVVAWPVTATYAPRAG